MDNDRDTEADNELEDGEDADDDKVADADADEEDNKDDDAATMMRILLRCALGRLDLVLLHRHLHRHYLL